MRPSTSADFLARPRPRHLDLGQPTLLRAAAKRAAFRGGKEYLGLGQNTPPSAAAEGLVPAAADRDCTLGDASGPHPISGKELQVASSILSFLRSVRSPGRDPRRLHRHGIEGRSDLERYRIIHFATHGVVTSPAAKCAAQPALLTSFGGKWVGRAADLQGSVRPSP